MRNLLLALAALLVLGGAAFLFLQPAHPPGPEARGEDASSEGVPSPVPGEEAVSGTEIPSAASPAGKSPGSRPAPGPPRELPDGAVFRPPQPPREDAPPGEIFKPDLPDAEAERVEETRRTLLETNLGRVEWRGRTLQSVAEEIASKSGVPVVLEGDDIADEPVVMGGEAVSARAALDHIAGSRTLRFEVQPGKVIIRR